MAVWTISAQLGTGGLEVATELAGRAGVPLLDRKTLAVFAHDLEPRIDAVAAAAACERGHDLRRPPSLTSNLPSTNRQQFRISTGTLPRSLVGRSCAGFARPELAVRVSSTELTPNTTLVVLRRKRTRNDQLAL